MFKGGKGLLASLDMGPKKPSLDDEEAPESSPDLGGEEEESGASDMALEDFADALDLDGEKRAEAISALKQAIEACMNEYGGGGKKEGL